MEDYVYDKLEEETQKKKLMNTLIDKNKAVWNQIHGYYKKSLTYASKIKQVEVDNYVKSSGEEKEKSKEKHDSDDMGSVMIKNHSLRKSFVISKRKSSLNFEKTSKILTENDEGRQRD